MSERGEDELFCANCGRRIQPHSADDTYCGENCQSEWIRKHWNLPSFHDEVRNGCQRFFYPH